MSNTYSITEAEITPARIADHHWRALMVDVPQGGTPPDLDDIAEQAASELHAHCGGVVTGAGAMAVARHFVILIVVYRIHAHRAGKGGYTIPDSVVDDYKDALKWAQKHGRAIVLAEGGAAVGNTYVEYTAPDATHDMDQLDRL